MVECERCGEAASPQVCPGDGRYHHHGMVHTKPDDGLYPVCDRCLVTVNDEWTAFRLLNDIERAAGREV